MSETATPFWKKELTLRRKKAAHPPQAKAKKPKRTRSPRGRTRSGQVVGLKIGASQIAAACVSNNGSAELVQLARADLEPGIVVGGELREPERLADALREFFKRHDLPRRGVRLGIANNRIGVRTFEIAGITGAKQLENAIRFRAGEALPIPLEEAVLDYRILSEREDDAGGPMKRVVLVVAHRELVDRYVGACRKAGIELSGIDLEAFALLRALAAPTDFADAPDAATVAVAVGYDRSTFAVSDGRNCEFTRVLDWGGKALDVAIARATDHAPSEVEALKRGLDLDARRLLQEGADVAPEISTLNVTPAPPNDATDAVRDAVRPQVQSFARDLVASLQFYQQQEGSLSIGEIVLTGGTSHLPGFAAELQRLIGVQVRIGDPLARVRVGKNVSDENQIGSLAIAIGLGIDD